MTQIFNGKSFASLRMDKLKERVAGLEKAPRLVSVVHVEDVVGGIYTRLKKEAAQQVGIDFEIIEVSFGDLVEDVTQKITDACNRVDVSGLLIQKPTRKFFNQISTYEIDFDTWWSGLTSCIDLTKDVDCLTRENLDKVYASTSDFLPATSRAVLTILAQAMSDVGGKNICVVGRSELVARPLVARLKEMGADVSMLGSRDDLMLRLPEAQVIVSTTGVANLISSEMVSEGAVVIDVGEPKGDVDFDSVAPKAVFITPVPGGVGPMTVVSLLENLLDLL